MPRFVVFWTTSTIKDEKSAAKFLYIKTVSGNVVAHSIAFGVVSMTTIDLPAPVNGILWEMLELITQERIAVGSSNLVDGGTRDPPCMTTDQSQNVKGQGHKLT